MKLKIAPSKICGAVSAPPSKSHAIRCLLAEALCDERIKVLGAGGSIDVKAAFSVAEAIKSRRYLLKKDGERASESPLNIHCGESATLLRITLPILAALGFKAEVGADEKLLKRPVNGLIDCLIAHGADIKRTENGFLTAGKLNAGEYEVDASVTSQYLSGLIFALPLLNGDSTVKVVGDSVSRGYAEMTISVLESFGIKVEKTDLGYFIRGGQNYSRKEDITVESDYSGAAFMLALGAVAGDVTVKGLDERSEQPNKEIVSVLKAFGAEVSSFDGGVRVKSAPLYAISFDCKQTPDLFPVIAAVAAKAQGESVIKGVSRLKYKEVDRVAAMIRTIKSAGAECFLRGDELHIVGAETLRGAEYESFPDHRIVMAQVVLSCAAGGVSTVCGAEHINKSYVGFVDDIVNLGARLDVNL